MAASLLRNVCVTCCRNARTGTDTVQSLTILPVTVKNSCFDVSSCMCLYVTCVVIEICIHMCMSCK